MIRYIIFFFVYILLVHPSLASDANVYFSGRASLEAINITLDKADEEWIQERNSVIKVGLSTPEYPPFDIIIDGNPTYYYGISADYLKIIADTLNLTIDFKLFSSREDAISALKKGDIDLITSSNSYEESHNLLLSEKYSHDYPALYVSNAIKYDSIPRSISVAYDYVPDNKLIELYSNSKLIKYPSKQQAISAAALGETDAVVVDLYAANYLIASNFSRDLTLLERIPIDTNGISFAFSSQNYRLKEIFDKIILKVPEIENRIIAKRWSGGLTIPRNFSRASFNKEEEDWLKKFNNTIRVTLPDYSAPMSYFDQLGNSRGMATDVLDIVSIYTDIKFEISRSANFYEAQKKLESDLADIALLSPSQEREKLLFSKVFARNPYAIVSPSKNVVDDNIKLRLAMPKAHSINKRVKEEFPEADLIFVASYPDALNAVHKKEADIAIMPLDIAKYYIGLYFQNELEVSKIIHSIPPAKAVFSANENKNVVIDILNRVIDRIPPDELQNLTNRWKESTIPSQETWRDYQYTIMSIVVSLSLIVIISLVWAWVTHRYYRNSIKAKNELKIQLKFMQDVVDGIPHPIYVRDISGKLILCNSSYQDIFKAKNKNEILHRTIAEGIDRVPEVTDLKKEYEKAVAEDRPIAKDRLIHIDGESVNIYHWIMPYKNNNGTVLGIVGGWIDISERIQLMEQLVIAKEAADGASKAKTQFLATMSHEIRTPMNAIIGLLELSLKRADHSHYDFNSIRVAYDSAKGLLEIIGDILDVIKIESGILDLKPEITNLESIVRSIIKVFDSLAIQKGVSLKLVYDNNLPQAIQIDPLRVKQILYNLIGNALKFTDKGEVKVIVESVSKYDEDTDDIELHIGIIDTGIGISIADQEKLFTPFTQVSDNNRGGTGLGLMICHSLCTLMGGSINLKSQIGKGTCIDVYIPTNKVKDKTVFKCNEMVITNKNLDSSPLHVLIADDHPANRLLLSQQLKHLGHRVEETRSGKEALSRYISTPFQLVITDCNMPEMDGKELSRNIRSFEKKNFISPTTIIGYTANAQNSVRDACLEAGMDDCLFKPISLDMLQAKINILTSQKIDLPSKKILNVSAIKDIAGDNEDFIKTLLQQLVTSNGDDLNDLDLAFDNDDIDSMKSIAHKIKGAAKILSAKIIVEQCEKLESSENIEAARIVYQSLRETIKKYNLEIEVFLKGNKF